MSSTTPAGPAGSRRIVSWLLVALAPLTLLSAWQAWGLWGPSSDEAAPGAAATATVTPPAAPATPGTAPAATVTVTASAEPTPAAGVAAGRAATGGVAAGASVDAVGATAGATAASDGATVSGRGLRRLVVSGRVVDGALLLGEPRTLRVTVRNRNDAPVLLTSVRASVASASAGCDPAWVKVAGYSSAVGRLVRAGGTTRVDMAIELRDLANVIQDACQGATSRLALAGRARSAS